MAIDNTPVRYLGIDYGEKRIGLSVGDSVTGIAAPLTTILEANLDRQIQKVLAMIDEFGAEELVIGLPLNMDGTEGPQAKLTRKFAARLSESIPKEIRFQDERLSSFCADDLMNSGDSSRKRKRRPKDSIAAQIILQDYLDNLR